MAPWYRRRPCGPSCAALRPDLVAELGDGAARCELVTRVVSRHGRCLPITRFLQFHKPGAGCCERLSGADPERVPNRRTAVRRPSTRARPWEAVPVVQSGARPPAPPPTYAAAWSSRSRAWWTWWAPWRVHWPQFCQCRLTGRLTMTYHALVMANTYDGSAREKITRTLIGDPNKEVPSEVRDLLNSSRLSPRVDSRLATCVMILLKKIEQIEGELNPEDD